MFQIIKNTPQAARFGCSRFLSYHTNRPYGQELVLNTVGEQTRWRFDCRAVAARNRDGKYLRTKKDHWGLTSGPRSKGWQVEGWSTCDFTLEE
jgi:hypothetical protein